MNPKVGIVKLTFGGKDYHFRVSLQDHERIMKGKPNLYLFYVPLKSSFKLNNVLLDIQTRCMPQHTSLKPRNLSNKR